MAQATPETIRILARQAARWSVAAKQDKNPLIGMLHANYGAAYVFALRQVASDVDVHSVLGFDAAEFERRITLIQDEATQRLARACPQVAPTGPLAKQAGEGLGQGNLIARGPADAPWLLTLGVLGSVASILSLLYLSPRRR